MLDFFRNGKENKTENAFMYGSFTTWMMCAVLISLTKKKKKKHNILELVKA